MAPLRGAAAAALCLMLGACSGSDAEFTTKGLRAPVTQCTVDPRTVGVARPLRDVDEGNGCEVDNAWQVAAIGDVQLSRPAVVNCGVVGPLASWVEGTVQPAAQRTFGESVVSLEIASSYACRARNNRRGAKMSEHGFGNAIDISAFVLESGRKVTVARGYWGDGDERRFLRHVRGQACAEFNTVLGPGSDAHHKDHFHLDMANRRSKYCR
jgi:hypothetical protein